MSLVRLEGAYQSGSAGGVALRLRRVDPREHLAGLDPIALSDRQADDLAHHTLEPMLAYRIATISPMR